MTSEPLTEAEWTDLFHIIARYSVHDRDARDIVAGLRSDKDFTSFLVTAERERIAPLVEAARQHVACICKGLVGEGPRPLGGGRVYHYTGCCADSDIAEALAEMGGPR